MLNLQWFILSFAYILPNNRRVTSWLLLCGCVYFFLVSVIQPLCIHAHRCKRADHIQIHYCLFDQILSNGALIVSKLIYASGLRPSYSDVHAIFVFMRGVGGVLILPGMFYCIYWGSCCLRSCSCSQKEHAAPETCASRSKVTQMHTSTICWTRWKRCKHLATWTQYTRTQYSHGPRGSWHRLLPHGTTM